MSRTRWAEGIAAERGSPPEPRKRRLPVPAAEPVALSATESPTRRIHPCPDSRDLFRIPYDPAGDRRRHRENCLPRDTRYPPRCRPNGNFRMHREYYPRTNKSHIPYRYRGSCFGGESYSGPDMKNGDSRICFPYLLLSNSVCSNKKGDWNHEFDYRRFRYFPKRYS